MMTNTSTATATTATAATSTVPTYHTHETVQMSYGTATITVLVVSATEWQVTRTDRYPSGNYCTYPVQTYPTRSKALFYGFHRIVRDARCA